MARLENTFSWSASRHRTYQDCRRRYYYAYYGSWGGWERDAAPDVRRLYLLKQVRTRHMWLGTSVHDQIKSILEQLRAGGNPQVDDCIERTLETMRQDFRDSREGKWIHNPKKICRLLEHERDLDVPDATWKALAERAKDCVRSFFRSPYYDIARTLPPDAWMTVERLESFDVEGIPLWVVLDFAFRRRDGNLTILDWKTGRRPRGAQDRLQLHTYALYAQRVLETPPEHLFCCAYYLLPGTGEEQRVREEDLEETVASIVASAATMRENLDDPERNLASIERFPRTDDTRPCQTCAYFEPCWDGRFPG